MKIIVGIATAGRREVLTQTLAHLSGQERLPDEIIVCPAVAEDVDERALAGLPVPGRVVRGPRGLCGQRNTILAALAADTGSILVFFDDDFLPAPDFLAQTERLFAAHPGVAMVTGTVLSDGILGPGFSASEGLDLLRRGYRRLDGEPTTQPVHNGYGCNMAVRLAPVFEHELRFDEILPLYGWLEDVDFSRRLSAHGSIVSSPHLQGVHLGSKRGRSPGKRLGYSQIANPLYLAGKRTLSARRAATQILRNVAANLARTPRPEPWVDRRGRLVGNLMAARDIVTRRLHPGRIVELD